ncbi:MULTISPECIES: 30S ribosomal protein S27e [Acidiplasma]|jgi:small subunit ribosomal protein S27e|uniref:Small ribosomal subunit protein eS27 n=2 Tax=Acidiplasma TaxID=507753 RepID=A0A0N8VL04_9ARCH|nr:MULTISPECIES: 30S ribosomal protein S27e [Acidiplasma]KPV47054.1 30S ribosomal protein S27 [Acidiplasma aeolicum]KQB34430.1 30S ribosomal protein S27 [Acidiplasma aeolicum]KQB35172.1 30S ribosomal protein S27 [Acidiplasma cupricumulans]WMT54237.1 MAG: 30S ribosomal protein S27e [Acidiplasma sp.]
MADEFHKLKNVGNSFVKIKCKNCGNEQVVYSKISSQVVCNICGSTLAKPTGATLSTSGELVEKVKL